MTRYYMAACLLILGIVNSTCGAANLGVVISPDADGVFHYVEDFTTPRLFSDAVSHNFDVAAWQAGALTHAGPQRHRELVYRFHGPRLITSASLQADHYAFGLGATPHLGGHNRFWVSSNGLDWILVGDTRDMSPGDSNRQDEPFTYQADESSGIVGGTELWLRLGMDNYSGLTTATSNAFTHLQVRLTTGDAAEEVDDPQAELRQRWGELRQAHGWRIISLDSADPAGRRAPCYLEQPDGWLLAPEYQVERSGPIRVQDSHVHGQAPALSAAAFVETGRDLRHLMARVVIRQTANSSRQVQVSWRNRPLTSFDAASFFEQEKDLFISLPPPLAGGVHELRISGLDGKVVDLVRVELAADAPISWARRPALPDGADVTVISAHYLPDPAPPAGSQVVEGRHAQQEVGLIIGGLQRFYAEHDQFGALRVTLHNAGTASAAVEGPILLNGVPIEDSYVDFVSGDWDARGVIWYRIRPRVLEPGQCAEIYVRFRKRPEGEAAQLTIPLAGSGPLQVSIPYEKPPVMVDYVTTDASGSKLYIHIRRAPDVLGEQLSAVALDGTRLDHAELFGPGFPGNVALAVAQLDQPLAEGSYHTVCAITDAGARVSAQFRVLPFIYPRSSIHVPPQLVEEMNMNMAMWHRQPLDVCIEHDILTSATYNQVDDLHGRVAFIMGPDEPDAKDNVGGGYDRGLGHYARQLARSDWQSFVQRVDPPVASWLIKNGTVRPLNWGVYGQYADISSFDPYPVNFYAADHAYVRESMEYVRRCSTPRRLFGCHEAFGWIGGQGVPRGARGPTPSEYRQNVVQSLGAGMKGLTSWTYTRIAGGWEVDEPVMQEIARVNALIAHIQDKLLLGTPVDLASSDAGTVMTGVVGNEAWEKERVAVSALLCGPDSLIITAANHIPASKPDPPVIEPARDVTITVRLPDFLQNVAAFEVTPEGLEEFVCEIADGVLSLQVDEIVDGRVWLLTPEVDDR